MKVVTARAEVLDLSESLMNEIAHTTEGVVNVTGCGVFDDEERLMPLISDYLSERVETDLLSLTSSKTYGHNLGYTLDYLKSRKEFRATDRDEAFIEAGDHVFREYFKHLIEKTETRSKTARNRDATLMSFMNDYLCRSRGGQPQLRETNPYSHGLITPAPKSELIQGCDMHELQALIEATPYERERCVVQFIFDAGIRRSELERVSLQHILDALKRSKKHFISQPDMPPMHIDYCPIYIEGSKARGNRTKPRWSIVSRVTLERVSQYHKMPLFRGRSRKYASAELTPAFFNSEGQSFSPRAVSSLIERLSERALSKGTISRSISPHTLRHGFAYAVLASPDLGADYAERLAIAQKSLGHAHSQTTENYNQVELDLHRKMMDANGVAVTRAQEIEALTKKTLIRIKPTDKK